MTDYEHRTPFLIIGGKVKEAVQQFRDHNIETHRIWWEEFAPRFNIKHYLSNNSVQGAVFEDETVIPEGWIHRQKDPYNVYVPKARTELRKEFDSLPSKWDASDFGKLINCPWARGPGNRILFPAFEILGDDLVLWISDAALEEGYTPPDEVKQIKMSEYYALKEQEADNAQV